MKWNLSKIKMIAMDVDGTLTDGKIYVSSDGEEMKAFSTKDGLGIKLLIMHDIMPVVITGRTSDIVRQRCTELGIHVLFQGVHNKEKKLQELMKVYELDTDEVAYIGDDLNDLGAMKMAGVTFAPADCAEQILPHVDIHLTKKAGDSPVREAIDMILEGRLKDEDYEGL